MRREVIEGRHDVRRQPGRPGSICILLDVSGSMDAGRYEALTQAFRELAKRHPDAIAIAFSSTAKAMRIKDFPSFERWNVGGGNGTTGIELAIPHRPERSFIISDGGIYCETSPSVEHPKVDMLTGTLTAIWICHGIPEYWSTDPYRQALADLARRGGGELHPWDGRSVPDLLNIVRTVRVHHHELPPEIIYHGRALEPVEFAPTTVRIRRR